MKYLKENQLELKHSFELIKNKILDKKPIKQNPYILAKAIYDIALSKEPDRKKLSSKIRAFHNFYGWKAWGSQENLGLCAGAIYRTSAFLNINPEVRTGRKNPRQNEKRIHIEHSLPINKIISLILEEKRNLKSFEDVFNLILSYSICTAFTEEEETNGIKPGFKQDIPEVNIKNKAVISPLKRYSDHIAVIDMISGKEVNKDTDLRQLTNYYQDYDIYNWNFIEKNYKKR